MENLFNVAMYYYKVKDVADLLLVNEATVRKWIKENRLPAISSGSKKNGYIITDIHLKEFLEKENIKYKERYELVKKTEDVGIYDTIQYFILEILYGSIPFWEYHRLESDFGLYEVERIIRNPRWVKASNRDTILGIIKHAKEHQQDV